MNIEAVDPNLIDLVRVNVQKLQRPRPTRNTVNLKALKEGARQEEQTSTPPPKKTLTKIHPQQSAQSVMAATGWGGSEESNATRRYMGTR